MRSPSPSTMPEIDVPPYYICPISLEIMKDPVTILTGITYDRDSIEKWIFTQSRTTCPVTNQTLPAAAACEFFLTPNVTLRRLIQSWCTLHAVERLPTPKPPATNSQISKRLAAAAETSTAQIKALRSLRSIASQSQSNRRCMESAGAADLLASVIVQRTLQAARPEASESDLTESRKAREEALTILFTLQLSESGLKSLSLNTDFLESVAVFMHHANNESRAHAVVILKSVLEVADPARHINLRAEFFAELAQILGDEQGVCRNASKAALNILIRVCPWGKNRGKAVEAGLVFVLINRLLDSTDKRAVEMILTVLDMLCKCAEGRSELIAHGAGLAVVSKRTLRISNAASERAVRILHSVSRFSATPGVLQEMMQAGVVAKLCLVVQAECGMKTKERAKEILKVHARAWRGAMCIPNSLVSSYRSS